LNTTKEIILGYGHENIQALHPTTIMITKDDHLSQKGDCIVVVSVNKTLEKLSSQFKNELRKSNSKLTVLFESNDLKEQITAFGSPKLILTHPTDMVIRKSNFICNRTLGINADKSSIDLSRIFVEKIKDRKQEIKMSLIVESY
jgi:hypothetical protein